MTKLRKPENISAAVALARVLVELRALPPAVMVGEAGRLADEGAAFVAAVREERARALGGLADEGLSYDELAGLADISRDQAREAVRRGRAEAAGAAAWPVAGGGVQ